MNFIIALCLTALYEAAPLASRSVDTHHKPASLEAGHHASRDNNIAELLIPILERSLDNTHDGKHKKVIQVIPYEGSKEHENKGWRKLKSNKKQLVEITPLRRKVGNNKHLAYILSAPKHVNDNDVKDSVASEENIFEDTDEFDGGRSESVDDKSTIVSDETTDKVEIEIDTVLSDDEDNNDIVHNVETAVLDKSIEKDVELKEPQSEENKEISNMISSEIVSVGTSEENYETTHVVEDVSTENTQTSMSVDSYDLEFGPGNNILFGRGSSESGLTDDGDEVKNEDLMNRSVDVNDEFNTDLESFTTVLSRETSDEKKYDFGDVSTDFVAQNEYQADAHDPHNSSDDPDGSDSENPHENSDVGSDIMIDRNGVSHELNDKNIKPTDGRSTEIIEVLKSVEEKGSNRNCDEMERVGEPWRVSRSREHKSYRLSFLFNK